MPSGDAGRLSESEYRFVYSKVPRLTVEILLRRGEGCVYLTKRAGGPCRGLWHIPGGTVRFAERLNVALGRIAASELSIHVVSSEMVGVVEYPSHFEQGLDSPVGLVFEVGEYEGSPRRNDEASDAGWFEELPEPMHRDQDVFLLEGGYVRR